RRRGRHYHRLGRVDRSRWRIRHRCCRRAYGLPLGVLAVKPISARHLISANLSPKVEHIASHRTESDVMPVDLTLNRTGLIGAFEVSREAVAVLLDLNVLHDRLAGFDAR